ncbi:MAG: TIGR00730 family Rossman fold protein [Phycisphaeraceae bacterium]|nr:TIGR00730 family Rossman fold protein [Phycisphaeraceae bacterium]
MGRELRRICVFCGANSGRREVFADAARDLGATLVKRRIELVYGGGHVGLMGIVANSALSHGGQAIGVIPRLLLDKELGHQKLTRQIVVESMHERKATMASLSDGFITLPGGMGTFEETFEVLTWAQLGIHAKPCGLLNVDGFFDPLLAFLDHAVAEGFYQRVHRDLLLSDTDPSRLLDRMAAFEPPREMPIGSFLGPRHT